MGKHDSHKDSVVKTKLKRKVKPYLFVIAFLVALAAFFVVVRQVEKKATPTVKSSDAEDRNKKMADAAQKTLRYHGKTYCLRNDVQSYLLIGTDNSSQSQANQQLVADGYIANMADFLALLVLDQKNESYTILPLDRNTITQILSLYPDGTVAAKENMQLCTAFFYGHDEVSGSENTVTAVSSLLKDTPIAGYATFDMDTIETLNHLVGGVSVTLNSDFSKSDPEMVPGVTITLSDEQAVLFVRGRMEVDDGTNEARIERQCTYLTELMRTLKDKTKQDPEFPLSVYDALTETLTTDFDRADVNRLGATMLGYTSRGIVRIEGETELGEELDDGEEHEAFYPDETSLMNTIIRLFYVEE